MNNKFFSFYLKNIAWFSAGVIFFIFDRILKFLAISSTVNSGQQIIGDLLLFNFVPNYNIAFSLPFSGLWLNILISLIIIILLAYLFKTKGLEKSALYLIIFGAISNIIDRWYYGYVIDYLDLKWFTIFNLADTLICCGTIVLIFSIFKKSHV